MPNTLIIGCGDVGGRLARLLAAAGHAVWGVRRSMQALPGVTMLAADVTRPFTLDMPPPDYLFILLSPDTSTADAYQQTYADSLLHIRAAVPSAALRRVFLVSSTSVYGEDAGEWIDEETPARPSTFNGEILLQAEQRARQFWPLTVVRFAGIYGEGRLWLLRRVAGGQPVDGGAWSNRIHAQDAAGLLAFLLAREVQGGALADLYLGVDDCPVLQAEVLDWIALRQGLPALPRLPGPVKASGRRISNRRSRALGFAPAFPTFREGYAQVLG